MDYNYLRDGYIFIDELINKKTIDAAREELENLFLNFPSSSNGAKLTLYDNKGINYGQARIDNPQLCSEAISNLILQPIIGETVSSILDCNVVQIWYCHALRKPPMGQGFSNVGWHQDGQYTKFLSGSFITAWIPLCRIDKKTAPLTYVLGSHSTSILDQSGFSYREPLESQKSRILDKNSIDWKESDIVGDVGSISFHHSSLIHSSKPNCSSVPRYSVTCHMRTEKNIILCNDIYKMKIDQFRDNALCPVIWGDPALLNYEARDI